MKQESPFTYEEVRQEIIRRLLDHHDMTDIQGGFEPEYNDVGGTAIIISSDYNDRPSMHFYNWAKLIFAFFGARESIETTIPDGDMSEEEVFVMSLESGFCREEQ